MKNLFQRMMPDADRPKLKIKLNTVDWLTEITAIVFLILLVGLPVFYFGELPERVPVHFNAAGQIDGYGSKSSFIVLPLTGLFMYGLLTVISLFPHIFNYPVKITPENAKVQYTLATRLLRILKTVILLMFAFISFQTLRAAAGKTGGLGKVFLPVFLIVTFGIVIVYLTQSLNNRSNS